MKCELKQLVSHEDGSETYTPCSRTRNMILNTRFGRLGVCEVCRDFVKGAEEEYRSLQAKAKGKPLGKAVKLDSGANGRTAPKLLIRFRHGHVVCDELPKPGGQKSA